MGHKSDIRPTSFDVTVYWSIDELLAHYFSVRPLLNGAMTRKNNRYVVRRDNNVLQVDFGREPDPPAPRFPGARGGRRLDQEDSESSWPFDATRVSQVTKPETNGALLDHLVGKWQ